MLNFNFIYVLLLPLIFISTAFADSSSIQSSCYPSTTIANGGLEMLLYLPDEEKGYYRGTRFDWSGLIQHVKYKGHTFFGDWKTTHDPANPEDANGIASEFGMGEFNMPAPLNFYEAKVGDCFIKIGIGLLKKVDDQPYKFMNCYEIIDAFPWTIQQGKNWIAFNQITTPYMGYAYRYTKRIEINGEYPMFTVYHTLENIGSKIIDQTFYCHSFYRVDDYKIGGNYILEFPFVLESELKWRGFAFTEKNRLLFHKPVEQWAFNLLKGFKSITEHNRVTIFNKDTNTAMHIKGSEPPVRVNFYATPLTVCPEAFISINLESGEAMSWENSYKITVD